MFLMLDKFLQIVQIINRVTELDSDNNAIRDNIVFVEIN